MIDDDGWCFMMMGIQYISRYQIWSNQEQVRETYVNGSHTPPSDRNRKKTTRSSPKTKQSGHSQRSSVRTYKVHQDHQDHQGQTKHHKTPAFRMVQRYMAQLHGSTMTVTMVHLSRAPSHRNRHVKHRRERVPPESICRLHSGTGGIFLSTSVHAAFNSISCGAVDREKNEAPPGWSKLFSGSLWCHVVPISWFFPRILFWIKALDFC